jgi:sporulation protein YlmC with PRC-barrel domain
MEEVERARDLIGSDVYDPDGNKIGRVGDVYVDDATQQPEWVTVRTGLFGFKETLVPLEGASTTSGGINVGVSKDLVKDAPRVATDHGHLSGQEGRDLYEYYGVHRSRASGEKQEEAGDETTGEGREASASPETSTHPDPGERAETTEEHRRRAGQHRAEDAERQPSRTMIPPKSMTSTGDQRTRRTGRGRHRKED